MSAAPPPPADPDATTKYRTLANADLVMKGGITSGVVYPKAVVRVARDYRIHNIGGTSVGAIAAVLTAASEYWRRTKPDASRGQQDRIDAIVTALDATDANGTVGWDDPGRADVRAAETALVDGEDNGKGFAGLYAIPQEIGSDLLGKFRPTAQTRGAFQFLVAWLEAKTPATRAVAALTRQFYLVRAVTAVLVALLALAVVNQPKLGLVPLAVLVLAGTFALLRDRLETAIQVKAQERGDAPEAPLSGWQGFLKRWQAPLSAALAVVLWAVMVEIGVGWPDVIRWTLDHWLALVAIALFISAVAVGDPVKRWLASWIAGDDAARQVSTLNRLHLATAVVSCIVLALLLWWQWDTVSGDPESTGPVAVGAALGWVGGGVIGLALNLLIFIPRNDNGICTGLEPPPGRLQRRFPQIGAWLAKLPGRAARPVALTDWLTAKIDAVAETPEGHHLTFADLEQATWKHPDESETGIAFEAICSELHRGVPLNLPRALDHYGFKPVEFLRFFPQSVVESILASSMTDYNDEEYRTAHPGEPAISADAHGCDIVRFPLRGAGIPVVVGARMSMSFPVLFSTVPVYHLGNPSDRSRKGKAPLRVPLSDGGIVSNFPIHKFDRALSPWPTFAIDLIPGVGPRPTKPSDDEFEINKILTDRVMGTTPQSTARMVAETSGTVTVKGLAALASHILNTARGWMDNSQKTLPGYAERIVGIRQYEGEGGLNLTMSHETIEALANRGMRGIDRLVKDWNPELGTGSQWHQHRWLRYRILMRSVENLGQEWKSIYGLEDAASRPSIRDLVGEAAGGTEPDRPAAYAYRWKTPSFGAEAGELTRLFDAFAKATPGPSAGEKGAAEQPTFGTFDGDIAPTPEPDLLMIPPFE